MKSDELFKKVVGGRATPNYGSEDIFSAASGGRQQNPNQWTFPANPVPPSIPVRPVKQPIINKISNFIAGAAEEPTYTGAKGEVLRNLPNEIVRTMVPGAAALNDNPELAAQVTNKDILKETPGAVWDVTRSYINSPIRGATELPNLVSFGALQPEIKFNLPILGEISNSDYRIAQRISNGEQISPLDITTEKVQGLMDAAFFLSLTAKLFTPRASAISGKGKISAGENTNIIYDIDESGNIIKKSIGGVPFDEGPKTFQVYQPETVKMPITSTQLIQLASDNNIKLSSNYNPANPVYFKSSGIGSDGFATGKFMQLKPSYFDKLMSVFKGDISKVPQTTGFNTIAVVEKDLNEFNKDTTVVPPVPRVVSSTIPESSVKPDISIKPEPTPGVAHIPVEPSKNPIIIKLGPENTKSQNIPVTDTNVQTINAINALRNQIGDTFKVVEPVGNLWQPKDNTIFIEPTRDQVGYVNWLRQKNFIESADEAGNGIYQVTIRPEAITPTDVTPKEDNVLIIKKVTEDLIPKIEEAVKTGDEHLIVTTRNIVKSTGDKQLISTVEKAIKDAQAKNEALIKQHEKINKDIEKIKQPPLTVQKKFTSDQIKDLHKLGFSDDQISKMQKGQKPVKEEPKPTTGRLSPEEVKALKKQGFTDKQIRALMVKAMEKNAAKKGYTSRDVTPKGYGPEEHAEMAPDKKTDYVKELEKLAEHENPEIRNKAAYLLGDLNDTNYTAKSRQEVAKDMVETIQDEYPDTMLEEYDARRTDPAELPEISKRLPNLIQIRPMEMPELVRLARELMGKFPEITKGMGAKMGVFSIDKTNPGNERIRLLASLFDKAGNDAQQAARVLAHEIGHLIDYLPEQTMKRGNILGRLQSLRGYLNETFTNAKGEISNTEIREELKEVTKYWHPYDPEAVSASYNKYRESAPELYADAISVLFNDPAVLEEMAPKFFNAFFDGLDNKPEVKRNYFELQELLAGNREEVIKARMDDMSKGFEKAAALQKDFEAKKGLDLKSRWIKLRHQIDDVNYNTLKLQAKQEAEGKIFDDENNPKYLLEELSMADNENFLLVNDIQQKIDKPLQDAGVTEDDIGKYLTLTRIATERADIANPYGLNAENAKEMLAELEKQLGPEKSKLLEDKMKLFHEMVFERVMEAVKVGSYNQEVFNTKILPNKDVYAAFRVVDYMQDFMPAGIHAQVGTLKEIENPYITTILKTISLNRLNALQRAKNALVKMLKSEPGALQKSDYIQNGPGPKTFKFRKDTGRLEVLEDGKVVGYDIDPYIAESFQRMKVGDLNQLVALVDLINNKVFKPLYTTFNLGFAAAFNPIRDLKRNYKMMGNAGQLLKAYVESLPAASKYAKGELDDFTRSLVESKAIEAPMGQYNPAASEDDQFAGVLRKYFADNKIHEPGENVINYWKKELLAKGVMPLLNAVKYLSNTLEIVSKIAGAKVRMQQGESGKELAYNLRNFTGTPNWRIKGSQTKTTNSLFIFSNIMLKGLEADLKIASDPKTRYGYWWRTAKVSLLPKLLMWMAAAGFLGKPLKDFYDKMTEYNKSNYLIIPLGIQEDGKAVGLRIPEDETGRLFSATMWKMLNFATKGDPQNLQDIFAFGAGQIPSFSPAITIPQNWMQYASGKNPYDSFRGQNIIDDTTWQAGGGAALKKMVNWTLNQSGQLNLSTFDTTRDNGLETAIRVLPGFNRLLTATNYGEIEAANKITEDIKQKQAQQTLKEKDIISEAIKTARKEGKTSLTDEEKYVIVDKIIGKDPADYTQGDKGRETRIMKKLDLGMMRGDNTKTDALLNAITNEEKTALLMDYQKTMPHDEFENFLQQSLDDGVISKNVYNAIPIETSMAPKKENILSQMFGAKTAMAQEFPQPDMTSVPLFKSSLPRHGEGMSVERIKNEIAFRESGVTDNAYSTTSKAKNNDGSTDYGKYQVNERTLKQYSKQFLGREVDPVEFLNSPVLQERFVENVINHFSDVGAKSLDAFLILWHRGWGNFSSSRIKQLKKDPEVKQYLNNQR